MFWTPDDRDVSPGGSTIMLKSQACLFILEVKKYIEVGAMELASNDMRVYPHLVLPHRETIMFQALGGFVYFDHVNVPH